MTLSHWYATRTGRTPLPPRPFAPPDAQLGCPTCGQPIGTEPPYWTVRGVFYCSQACARGVA